MALKNFKTVKGATKWPNTNWIAGSYEYRGFEFYFEAKGFPEPSIWGINDGYISKLYVKNTITNKCVFNYDRGYDVGNEKSHSKGMLKDLLEELTKICEAGWGIG